MDHLSGQQLPVRRERPTAGSSEGDANPVIYDVSLGIRPRQAIRGAFRTAADPDSRFTLPEHNVPSGEPLNSRKSHRNANEARCEAESSTNPVMRVRARCEAASTEKKEGPLAGSGDRVATSHEQSVLLFTSNHRSGAWWLPSDLQSSLRGHTTLAPGEVVGFALLQLVSRLPYEEHSDGNDDQSYFSCCGG